MQLRLSKLLTSLSSSVQLFSLFFHGRSSAIIHTVFSLSNSWGEIATKTRVFFASVVTIPAELRSVPTQFSCNVFVSAFERYSVGGRTVIVSGLLSEGLSASHYSRYNHTSVRLFPLDEMMVKKIRGNQKEKTAVFLSCLIPSRNRRAWMCPWNYVSQTFFPLGHNCLPETWQTLSFYEWKEEKKMRNKKKISN